ncbi:hypothetical protein BU16DRAFT_522018 [Lophium mytilinum]|uniref:Rhodopsin domain-containing protein n=1 Tax=Lophium mytilinum TaxID=390894 RepID=A0A6A6R812_9PEZI|nr:hypothetical protein BU16DRAFT_522018 [Lophium mytilinum]
MGITGASVMATEWALLVISFIFVGTRLVVRLLQQQKSLVVSDAFLLISSILALGLAITDTMTYQLGGMGDAEVEDPKKIVKLAKIAFAGNYFYDTAIYFPKFSILALYTRLFPNTMPRLRQAFWVVTGFTTASCVLTCFADTFWCGSNVASNWSLKEGACSSFDSLPLFHLDWALNFISDVFIFALPFPLLRHLKLKKTQLYGLIFTFGLGLITIAVNVARFTTIIYSNEFNSVYVMSMAEMATSIIVACLPALRPLLRKAGELSTSSDPKSSNPVTRVFNSVLSKSGLSSRTDARTQRGKGVDRMERLSDGGDSQVELTTRNGNPGIYKSQDVSVQSTQVVGNEWTTQEAERQRGLGTSSKAWGA